MTLLLIALLVGIAGAGWVIYPLVYRRSAVMSDVIPVEIVEGEARRFEALSALKEAQYDHAAGKLDEADYGELRTQLEVEALAVLRSNPAAASSASGGPAHTCGFVNPADSRFCAGCGQALG